MSINLAEHELAGQCREATGARTPSASGPTNFGRGGRNAQSRTPPSFGFDPIEGLATGSVSWLDAQPPFDPGNGGESQGFRVFGCNGGYLRGSRPVRVLGCTDRHSAFVGSVAQCASPCVLPPRRHPRATSLLSIYAASR